MPVSFTVKHMIARPSGASCCDMVKVTVPGAVNPGASGKLKASLDTSGMPSGEVLVILTLTTNSPLRPMVNLFISGWIE
jgi:hypothetical protein